MSDSEMAGAAAVVRSDMRLLPCHRRSHGGGSAVRAARIRQGVTEVTVLAGRSRLGPVFRGRCYRSGPRTWPGRSVGCRRAPGGTGLPEGAGTGPGPASFAGPRGKCDAGTPARLRGAGTAFPRIARPRAGSTTVDHLSLSCRPLSFVTFFPRMVPRAIGWDRWRFLAALARRRRRRPAPDRSASAEGRSRSSAQLRPASCTCRRAALVDPRCPSSLPALRSDVPGPMWWMTVRLALRSISMHGPFRDC